MDRNVCRIVKIMQIVTIVCSMYMMYIEVRKRLRKRVRAVNVTRNKSGLHGACFLELKMKGEEHFFKATRMSVPKFHTLLALIRERLQRFSGRAPINEESRLALTLMYLSQGCTPQFLACSQQMGVSTVRDIIYDTCNALWTELHDIYVAQPNRCDWKNISDRFYIKTGMPHCLGAVDGKHLNVVCPISSSSLCYNYKQNYSIVLMAACDSNYAFTFVDVGALGSQSDGKVFSRSLFEKMILRGHLDVPPEDNVPGTQENFQYYFVGDSAFPLKRNLMRPYPGRNLSTKKKHFNKKLSGARVYIENAFGILSNKWRVLENNIHAAPKNVDKIVLATIVLHNYLMLDKDSGYFTEDLVDHVENGIKVLGTWRQSLTALSSCKISQASRSAANAFSDRDALADLLFR